MTTAIATAATAFRRTLDRLGLDAGEQSLGEPTQFGQRAALLAAADSLWRRHLGGLLSLQDVQAMLGVRTRQAIHDLVRRGRLLGLPTREGRTVYPCFQFGPDGRPYPEIASVLLVFHATGANHWTVASWFTTEQPELGGRTPAAWLADGQDAERLVEVARHSAAPLAW